MDARGRGRLRTRSPLRKLAGVGPLATDAETLDAIIGVTLRSSGSTNAASAVVASGVVPSFDASRTPSASLQSAPEFDIDWSREPLSDRERRVRSRWIANRMASQSGRMELRSVAIRLKPRAQDIAAAYEEACAAFDREQAERLRESYRQAAAELDAADSRGSEKNDAGPQVGAGIAVVAGTR